MANEISVQVAVSCTKAGVTAGVATNLVQSQTGNNFGSIIQTLGASAAVVPVGGATTGGGWMTLTNLGVLSSGVYTDAGLANIYNDGTTGTSLVGTLAFGESMTYKPPTLANVSAKYATAALDLSVLYIEP